MTKIPSAKDENNPPLKQVDNKGSRKLAITGAVTAAIACAVCLVPTAFLVVAGGSALAFASSWLGYTILAAAIFSSTLAFAYWYNRKRKRSNGLVIGKCG